MKKCGKCLKSKPVTEYTKNSAAKDGLQSWCKQCHIDYREVNRSKFRAASAKWYENNKEYRSEYARQWYLRKKEAAKAGEE